MESLKKEKEIQKKLEEFEELKKETIEKEEENKKLKK
jgi:hypothetical protein